MTIQIGDRIPEVVLKYIDDGVQAIDTPTLFDGSKVVLFAVPGAFTPTCSERHLPGFIERFDRFRELGVEVACMVDRNGVQPTHVGPLPEQCAAMNVTNINTQILTVEAALNRRKDTLYQAAMLDPHTLAELTLDQIVALCDDLIEAHGDMLPPMT